MLFWFLFCFTYSLSAILFVSFPISFGYIKKLLIFVRNCMSNTITCIWEIINYKLSPDFIVSKSESWCKRAYYRRHIGDHKRENRLLIANPRSWHGASWLRNEFPADQFSDVFVLWFLFRFQIGWKFSWLISDRGPLCA